ncbi:MAG: SDR family oxidoreductase [Gemmataceae bacterium]|nr:SDR family oxidoreductase [Gemmataceae bacterium]
MPTVLLTGANRGLGLEFARQYAAAGWRVVACCREPARADELRALPVEVKPLDVRDLAGIALLADDLKGQPIDLLLANAGVYGPAKMFLGQLDYAAWAEVLLVNTLAPVRLAECFADHVAASGRKLIACVSSRMGSIGDNATGRHYLYRSSKAALNAAARSLSIDLKERGVTVVALHPGWVKTDMGGQDADLEIPDAVRSIIATLDKAGPAQSGKFLDHDGTELPW